MDKIKFLEDLVEERNSSGKTKISIRQIYDHSIQLARQYNLSAFGTETPDWKKMTFRQRSQRGFCLPFIEAYDSLFSERYSWWNSILRDPEKMDTTTIPQIDHESKESSEAMDMILDCMRFPMYSPEERFRLFVVFVANGLGADDLSAEMDTIPEPLVEHFYRNFNVLFLQYKVFDHLRYYAEKNGFIPSVEYNKNLKMLSQRQSFEFRAADELTQYNGLYDNKILPIMSTSAPFVLGVSNHTLATDIYMLGLTNNTEDLIKKIHLTLFAPQIMVKTENARKKIHEKINQKEKETKL